MRVIICDLTGQLSRGRRQELEARLAALARAMPAVDTAEIDLEPPPRGTGVAVPCKRVILGLHANHRRVVRVTGEAPTLAGALAQAMSDTVRERDAFAPAIAQARNGTPH